MTALMMDLVIFLVIVCLLAGVILWAVERFFSAVLIPAKWIVGGLALLAILHKVRPILAGAF